MAKKKYICTGCHKCTEPCTVELSGDADMTKDPNKMLHCGTWLEVPAEECTDKEQLPKLTVEVFSMDACPLWARYAAVDENGKAYWYDEKPMLGSQSWDGTGTHFARQIAHDSIGLSYDASDWKTSLLERPVEERLPKLTDEVFSMPECPVWACYAAVDSDGVAYWYDAKPELDSVCGGWLIAEDQGKARQIKARYDFTDWKHSLVRRLRKLTEEIFDHPECPADAVVAVVNAAGTAAWGNRADIVCDGDGAFLAVQSGSNTWTPIPGGACFDATDWQHSAVYKAGADPRCTEPAPLKLTYDVFSYSNPNGWTYVIRSQVEHGKTYARCPEWARYAAVDQSGAVCVYDTKPVLRSTDWYPDSGGRCAVVCNADKLALSFDTTGWKNSLIERPESECMPKLTPDVFSYSTLNDRQYVMCSCEEYDRTYTGCPDWARYAAVNKSGEAYVYENKPVPRYTVWTDNGGRYARVLGADKQELKFDGTDWKNSLIELPSEEQLPKLTHDVFDRLDCPSWARYAAVDADGMAYWYEDEPIRSDRGYKSLGTSQCICISAFDATDWEHSLLECHAVMHKLTTDVFSMKACPAWARYAAVDANGFGYWYAEKPEFMCNRRGWIGASERNIAVPITREGTRVLYDSSDWQHSLIERPAVVPEWFKPGVLAYNMYTHTCFHVTASTEYRENYLEAKVRPFSADELARKLGQFVLGPTNSRLLVTGYCAEGCLSGKPEICVLGDKWLTAEELLTYGSRPQGIKQYHSKEGTWIDCCGMSS